MGKAQTAALDITSPACVASWPHLDAPDTKFAKRGQSPKYKVDMVLDPDNEEHAAFMTTVTDYYDQAYQDLLDAGEKVPQKDGEDYRCPSPLKPQLDKDKNPTGLFTIQAKMSSDVGEGADAWTQSPKIYDAAAKPVKDLKVGGGSLIKVSCHFFPFSAPWPVGAGISCRLKGVQVLKLVSQGGQSAEDMGFGVEEGGFVAENAEGFRDENVASNSKGGNY